MYSTYKRVNDIRVDVYLLNTYTIYILMFCVRVLNNKFDYVRLSNFMTVFKRNPNTVIK